ncbi:MAG: 3-isopropylmalate dehydratase small subunit [Gammaproteobacteria bacterium]|nr:MAG: 3-isopropylmalate dehydratase small subunit [Gammaproteobacteria bacterium]
MKKFKTFTAIVASLNKANVDTDAIIPKQYLKSIKKTGFGPYLFDDWRYLDMGDLETDISSRRLNPDFVLNKSPYNAAQILLADENFGCGSSREHAVWALADFGFKVVIAPSFADIFFNNCFKNGVLPIVLSADEINTIFAKCQKNHNLSLKIDLEKQTISTDNNDMVFNFNIDEAKKHRLLNGLDDIAMILQHSSDIKNYEKQRQKTEPWIFV